MKDYNKALNSVAEMEKVIHEIYGPENNLYLESEVCLRRTEIYKEVKGEEYKA